MNLRVSLEEYDFEKNKYKLVYEDEKNKTIQVPFNNFSYVFVQIPTRRPDIK